jgi:hypothetical protein
MQEDKGKVPLIKDWLQGFMADHRASRPGDGWPEVESVSARRLWSDWFNHFRDAKVTELEARSASKQLGEAFAGEKLWCDEHLETLLKLIGSARAQAMASPPDDRAEAERLSRDCPHCSGGGYVTVYDHKYDGHRAMLRDAMAGGQVRKLNFAMVVSAHCTCAMGRRMRSKVGDEDRKRIPDLADVLAGRGRWQVEDPTGDVPFDAGPAQGQGGAVPAAGGRIDNGDRS